MATTGLQLRSEVSDQNTIQLSLEEVNFPDPGPDEVLVRVDATPINPSDLGLLVGPADGTNAQVTGTAERPVVTMGLPEGARKMMAARVGQSLPVGNEGAGEVVAAGESPQAQALLGRTVGMIGGEMYGQYRCLNLAQVIVLEEGTSAESGASCFVNPMTALAMVETMRREGHSAIVHTAAASNLGQMLNRLCISEGIRLVNIVRKPEQQSLLREQGAEIVLNSESDSFLGDLTAALADSGATIAFDAIGGGKLVSRILSCMEAAAAQRGGAYSRYGSDTFKQVYIYGALDTGPSILNRNFGFSWAIGGWLLLPVMQILGDETVGAMRKRVAAEIDTTFASHYSRKISLLEALDPDVIVAYCKKATGEKFLIEPQR